MELPNSTKIITSTHHYIVLRLPVTHTKDTFTSIVMSKVNFTDAPVTASVVIKVEEHYYQSPNLEEGYRFFILEICY